MTAREVVKIEPQVGIYANPSRDQLTLVSATGRTLTIGMEPWNARAVREFIEHISAESVQS